MLRRTWAIGAALAITFGITSGCGNENIGDGSSAVSTEDVTEAITIEMSVRIWAGIDASLDNLADGSNEDGSFEDAALADEIREAGAAQVPFVDGEWPPSTQLLKITLTQSQWQVIVSGSAEEVDAYEAVGDTESVELARAAKAAIEPHLR